VRNQAVDVFLQASPPVADSVRNSALEAKTQFFLWHAVSLLLNFGTVALVTVAMALAACLPDGSSANAIAVADKSYRREPAASAVSPPSG
jgi:hypothetical protein